MDVKESSPYAGGLFLYLSATACQKKGWGYPGGVGNEKADLFLKQKGDKSVIIRKAINQ